MSTELEYQGYLVIPDFLTRLPIKDELKQKYGITNSGFAIVMANLLRRSKTINNSEVEVTSSFIADWTGYSEPQIKRYFKALKEMKFISWESVKGKPRTITINYDLLNKMSRKYNDKIGVASTPVVVKEKVDEVPAQPLDDIDITNRIVSFLVEKGTTIDIDYIDELRDTICNGDEELRRRCTRAAKQIIRDKKLI